MIIKGVLKEELANSLRMKKQYEMELAKLPIGSLVKRKIKGQIYYYLVFRKAGEFKCRYMGKQVPGDLALKYREGKSLRAKYRRLLSHLKKQIRFLSGALRGKEDI
jgi:hypothetical protein